MGKADKILERMARNPKADFRIEELQTAARAHGVRWRQRGTSHVVFIRPDGRAYPVPVHKGHVKAVYVRHFVGFIREEA